MSSVPVSSTDSASGNHGHDPQAAEEERREKLCPPYELCRPVVTRDNARSWKKELLARAIESANDSGGNIAFHRNPEKSPQMDAQPPPRTPPNKSTQKSPRKRTKDNSTMEVSGFENASSYNLRSGSPKKPKTLFEKSYLKSYVDYCMCLLEENDPAYESGSQPGFEKSVTIRLDLDPVDSLKRQFIERILTQLLTRDVCHELKSLRLDRHAFLEFESRKHATGALPKLQKNTNLPSSLLFTYYCLDCAQGINNESHNLKCLRHNNEGLNRVAYKELGAYPEFSDFENVLLCQSNAPFRLEVLAQLLQETPALTGITLGPKIYLEYSNRQVAKKVIEVIEETWFGNVEVNMSLIEQPESASSASRGNSLGESDFVEPASHATLIADQDCLSSESEEVDVTTVDESHVPAYSYLCRIDRATLESASSSSGPTEEAFTAQIERVPDAASMSEEILNLDSVLQEEEPAVLSVIGTSSSLNVGEGSVGMPSAEKSTISQCQTVNSISEKFESSSRTAEAEVAPQNEQSEVTLSSASVHMEVDNVDAVQDDETAELLIDASSSDETCSLNESEVESNATTNALESQTSAYARLNDEVVPEDISSQPAAMDQMLESRGTEVADLRKRLNDLEAIRTEFMQLKRNYVMYEKQRDDLRKALLVAQKKIRDSENLKCMEIQGRDAIIEMLKRHIQERNDSNQ